MQPEDNWCPSNLPMTTRCRFNWAIPTTRLFPFWRSKMKRDDLLTVHLLLTVPIWTVTGRCLKWGLCRPECTLWRWSPMKTVIIRWIWCATSMGLKVCCIPFHFSVSVHTACWSYCPYCDVVWYPNSKILSIFLTINQFWVHFEHQVQSESLVHDSFLDLIHLKFLINFAISIDESCTLCSFWLSSTHILYRKFITTKCTKIRISCFRERFIFCMDITGDAPVSTAM